MSLTMPLFALDVDGVACAHAEAICGYVERKHQVKSTVTDVTSWDHDFGPLTFVQAVHEAYQDEAFVLEMQVRPHFQSFLNDLSNRCRVIFASARQPYCQSATRKWIHLNLGDYTIHFTQDKDSIPAQYLLDDNPVDVLPFAKEGKTAFLLQRPWNKDKQTQNSLEQSPGCYLVSGYHEVLTILQRLEGK